MSFLAVILASQSMLAQPRPSSGALKRAFEIARPTVVVVQAPTDGPQASRARTGLGTVVGEQGHIATAVTFVGLRQATVRRVGQESNAKVLAAHAELGIAVLLLDPPVEARAAAVRLDARAERGAWVIGITRDRKGELVPRLGQITQPASAAQPYVETDLRLPPGSPLFDTQGRLLAIAAPRARRAVPMDAIKELLASTAALEGPAR